MTLCEDVAEFHRAMGQPVADDPGVLLTVDRIRLRLSLILEETAELADALGSDGGTVGILHGVIDRLKTDAFSGAQDIVGAADALADIQYVTAGTAVEMGIPLGDVLREVHKSNMTKPGGPTRADGKVLKGPHYRPPDVAGVLERHRAPRVVPMAPRYAEAPMATVNGCQVHQSDLATSVTAPTLTPAPDTIWPGDSVHVGDRVAVETSTTGLQRGTVKEVRYTRERRGDETVQYPTAIVVTVGGVDREVAPADVYRRVA